MRKYFSFPLTVILFLFLSGCNKDEPVIEIPRAPEAILLSEAIFYEIDLNDRSGDTFKVRAFVEGLEQSNGIFQFPSTVPGTYSVLNFGNYVADFRAYDQDYNTIATEKISTNQWRISDPQNTHIIEYEIAETWDDPEPDNFIYKMAGTSLENDHALLNTFAVLGYPTGLKDKKYYLHITYPGPWIVGTSLPMNEKGYYVAEDYDFLVDNPLLLGTLSNAETIVDNTEVDVWTYSMTGMIHSSDILDDIDQVIIDASAFLNGLPVDRYNFLFHFSQYSAGALEHSYSSVYVLREMPLSENYIQLIKDISAHEFFHIVTPLNIQSEIIQNFNFVTPTPSAHLWLYEGVTEWASHVMQYRNNSTSLQTLLNNFSVKLSRNSQYDETYSLTDISLFSYTPEGSQQFGNIYNRGAIVAALLDIRLLELSNGEYGLRELILQLINIYGPDDAFQDDQFFDVIVAMTFPEIEDFINSYIKGTEPLPVGEYFAKIGIAYEPFTLTLMDNLTPEQEYLFNRWSMNF